MMGSGKTSVGEELAGRLGWDFLDSDREIEALTGSTVPQIFAASGEAVFRGLEARVLADALARREPAVVAAAGGAVLDQANRRLLREHYPVVWLRARIQTLIERVGAGSGRPLLDHDVAGSVTRLDAMRRPLYAEVADVVVDVDRPAEANEPADIAGRVLTAVASSASGRAS